jgi:protein-disulfide isomerase
MDKRFLGIVIVVVVALIGIFIVTGNNGKTTTSGGSSTQPTSHIEGTASTGVSLLEYGDYECPYCGEYYPIVKQVAAVYSNYMSFQFRNLPLTQLHPNAFAGARAAEAAALQDKFWQMHDALYENQNGWVDSNNPETMFVQYAEGIGLNIAKFKTDFVSDQVNNSINADLAAFAKTGAQEATPTFFLDGTQISPGESVSSFETLINAAIQKKTGKASPVSVSPSASTATTAPQSKQ